MKTIKNESLLRTFLLAFILGFVLFAAGCEKKSAGDKIDDALDRTEERMDDAGDKIRDGIEDAGDKIEESTDE